MPDSVDPSRPRLSPMLLPKLPRSLQGPGSRIFSELFSRLIGDDLGADGPTTGPVTDPVARSSQSVKPSFELSSEPPSALLSGSGPGPGSGGRAGGGAAMSALLELAARIVSAQPTIRSVNELRRLSPGAGAGAGARSRPPGPGSDAAIFELPHPMLAGHRGWRRGTGDGCGAGSEQRAEGEEPTGGGAGDVKKKIYSDQRQPLEPRLSPPGCAWRGPGLRWTTQACGAKPPGGNRESEEPICWKLGSVEIGLDN